MNNANWGPIVTIVAACLGIISGMAILMLRGLKNDVRDIAQRHTNLYTWSENKFVTKEVCDERHKER